MVKVKVKVKVKHNRILGRGNGKCMTVHFGECDTSVYVAHSRAKLVLVSSSSKHINPSSQPSLLLLLLPTQPTISPTLFLLEQPPSHISSQTRSQLGHTATAAARTKTGRRR